MICLQNIIRATLTNKWDLYQAILAKNIIQFMFSPLLISFFLSKGEYNK